MISSVDRITTGATPGEYMKLSRELCKQYVTRQQLCDMTRLLWEIPRFVLPLLRKYAIEYYNGFEVTKMNDGGVITSKNGTRYIVQFYKCTPEAVYNADFVAISYRKPIGDYRLPAYAMVRIVKKETIVSSTMEKLEAAASTSASLEQPNSES